MDKAMEEHIEWLEQNLRGWEEQIRFWEDPLVISTNIDGSKENRIAVCKARAQDCREQIELLRKSAS